MKTKFFTLFLALLASIGIISAATDNGTCGTNLKWSLDKSTGILKITGSGTMTSWSSSSVVPWYSYRSSIKSITIGNFVTSIGDWAFYDCSGLTSITIPSSVTSIGSYAFRGCSGLTSVTIPSSVKSIGDYAFRGCSGLTSVTIPNSVTSIGVWAFYDCSGLTSPVYNAHVFAYMPTSCSGAYTIPNGIESIAGGAFYGCPGLTSVTIPNSVTSIGEGAFKNCTGLTSVTIPNSVTSIGSHAFSYCTGLTSVTIPNSVESIGDHAFENCTGLTSVTIGNSVTSIGSFAFFHCYGLTSVTIGNSVTSIGSYAFCACYRLTSVTIPNSVTSIGESAFYDIPNIVYSGNAIGSPWGAKNVNGYVEGYLVFSDDTKTNLLACSVVAKGEIIIPNSVTSIGKCAFSSCYGLTSVTIPNSVTSIGNQAFYGCSGLTSVTIPNSVTSIGDSAFCACSKLAKVEINSSTVVGYTFKESLNMKNVFGAQVEEYIIGEGVTSIGSYAFCACYRLTSVTIPHSVTSIGSYAFYGCTGLRSVTIPNSVTSIGSYAFCGCKGLTSVTIPNSVTSIGSYAFSECPNITSVIWNAKNCNNWNFGNQVESFVFGDSVEVIPDKLCARMNKLTSITIPSSVASIGEDAFKDCSELRSVHINDLAAWCKIKFSNKESNPAATLYLNDSKITDLVIPNSVTSIGNYAFYYCYGLTSVTCEATIPPTYGKSAFSSKKFPLYVPSNSVSAYKTANEWRDFLIIRAIGSDTTFTCAEASETAFRYAINGNSSAKVSIVGYVTNIAEEWSYRYANISFWMADTKGGGKVFEAFRVKCDTQEEAPVVGDKVKVYGCLTVYDEKIPEIAAGGTFEILERADGIPVQADEINNNEVKATPTDDGSVVITWPEVEGATSYTIDIRKKGELICTLVFNSNGQLISIKFAAPSRNENRRDVAAATQAKKGWSYTITGMESGATYTYSVTAKNDSGTKLFEQSIEYTMPAVQGIVDIDASANQCGIHKFIKNGQLYIQRGDELFNAQGARVE